MFKPTLYLSFFVLMVITFSLSGQNQTDKGKEARVDYMKANNDLNDVYQKILKKYSDDTVFVNNLRSAHRIWTRYRESELRLRYPNGSENSNSKQMCEVKFLKAMTEERIRTLKVWLDGVEDGSVCAGSIRHK